MYVSCSLDDVCPGSVACTRWQCRRAEAWGIYIYVGDGHYIENKLVYKDYLDKVGGGGGDKS